MEKTKDTLTIILEGLENLEFGKITKPITLSVDHTAFDPIGFSSPVFLLPKLSLQRLWKEGFSWDMEVDDSINAEFLSWYNELFYLKEISILRWFSYDFQREFSVHTFCDASLLAYSAAALLEYRTQMMFIRVERKNQLLIFNL